MPSPNTDNQNIDEVARRLAMAEIQAERSKMVMDSLAGFCHALGQPATVLLSGIELLKMAFPAEKDPNAAPMMDDAQVQGVLDMCYDAVIEMRSVLAEMKQRREFVSEAYLANNDKAGTMISLQEWRDKAPPSCHWENGSGSSQS